MTNKTMIKKVLVSIINHPEHHNQDDWFSGDFGEDHDESLSLEDLEQDHCGTSACVAGWATLHDGWKVTHKPFTTNYGTFWQKVFEREGQVLSSKDGQASVSSLGEKALGLDEDSREGGFLFYETTNEEAIACLYSLLTTGKIHEDLYGAWNLSYGDEGPTHDELDEANYKREKKAAELAAEAHAEFGE